MTLMPPTRKRSRSCEEEEFLPLSKKINNLHINNWSSVDSPQEQLLNWNNSPEQYLSAYSEGVSNGRQDCESNNSTSPFKSTQNNLQNCYNETDRNEQFNYVNNESYNSGRFAQEKFAEGEGSNSDGGPSSWSTVYDPDLGVNENPYYYESNKLLFGLYIDRIQRAGY